MFNTPRNTFPITHPCKRGGIRFILPAILIVCFGALAFMSFGAAAQTSQSEAGTVVAVAATEGAVTESSATREEAPAAVTPAVTDELLAADIQTLVVIDLDATATRVADLAIKVREDATTDEELAEARFTLIQLDGSLSSVRGRIDARLQDLAEQKAILTPAAPPEGQTALPNPNEAQLAALTLEQSSIAAISERLGILERRVDVVGEQLVEKRRSRFLGSVFTQNRTLFDRAYWESAVTAVPDTLRKISALVSFRLRAAQATLDLPWFKVVLGLFLVGSILAIVFGASFLTRELANVLRLTGRGEHVPIVRAVTWRLIGCGGLIAMALLFVWGFSDPLRLAEPFGHIIIMTAVAISSLILVVSFVPLSSGLRRRGDVLPIGAHPGLSRFLAVAGHWLLAITVSFRLFSEAVLTRIATPLELQLIVGIPVLILMAAALLMVSRPNVMRGVWIESRSRLLRLFASLVRWISTLAGLTGLLALALGYLALAELVIERAALLYVFVSALWLVRRLLEKVVGIAPHVVTDAPADEAKLPRSSFWLLFVSDGLLLLFAIPFALWFFGYDMADASTWLVAARDGIPVGSVKISLTDVAWGIAIFVGILFLARGLRRIVENTILPQTTMDDDVRHSLLTLLRYIGIFIASLIGLTVSGLDLSRFALVAGALSVGIGFGLQAIVSNFISGIIILFERPIKINDWVVTSSGEGTVKRINIRSTEIDTFDGSSIIVPNSEFITSTINNWTHRNKLGRVNVRIGVAYGSDLKQVEAILYRVANAHPKARQDPAPYVYLADFGASSIDYDVRVYLFDIGQGLGVKHELRNAFFDALTAANIEIPFAQSEMIIKPGSELTLKRG